MVECALCAKTFSSSSGLHLHMFTHTKERPHMCQICSVAFGQEGNLKKHIKLVHDGIERRTNKNHHCTICSYKCCSKGTLQVHVRKHSAERPFSCPITTCGFKTKYKCSLPRHALRAHSDKRAFKCPSDGCSYKAKTRYNMRVHLRVHSNDKPFVCAVSGCNHTCKSKSELKVHISRVHSNEKPFKCSVCDFRAKVQCDVSQHERTHMKIKCFQCHAPNCGFATHTRSRLKWHFDREHKAKEVLCTEPRCNFRCRSITLLKAHLRRHELPILNKEEKARHMCSLCCSRLSNSSLLKAHVRRHIREKPYSCSHCSYTTMYSFQLNYHARNIHKIYVIPCGKNDQVRKCRTCGRNCFSYGESVIHSMSHLQPVVVLEQLKVQVL